MNDFISESSSKGAKDVVASSLTSVTLSKEQEKSYNDTFFPGRSVTKTRKTSAKHYDQLINSLVTISAGLNNMFNAGRFALSYGQIFDTTPIEEIKSTFGPKIAGLTDIQGSSLVEASKEYHSILADGKSFYIAPSTRYPGGHDIIFGGNGKRGTIDVAPYVNYSVSTLYSKYEHTNQDIENTRMSHYLTERSKKVTDAGKDISARLFPDGAGNTKSQALKRVVQVLPLDFDFMGLGQTMSMALGDLDVDNPVTTNVPDNIVQSLGEYASIIVVRQPNRDLVREAISDSYVPEGQTAPPFDAESKIVEEGFVLNQKIGLSLAFSLPPELSRYITQTPENEEVSLASLTNWARIWAAAMLRKSGARASGGATMGGRRIPVRKLPRYILPASKTKSIKGLREQSNYYIEEGKTNDDNLYVSGDGSINYAPKASAELPSNVENYERELNEVIQEHYRLGIPLDMARLGHADPSFFVHTGDMELGQKIADSKKSLKKYAGAFVAQTWDYDTQLHIDPNDPSRMNVTSLAGSIGMDETVIASLLGFVSEQAKEAKFPTSFANAVVRMVPKARNEHGSKFIQDIDLGSSGNPIKMLDLPLFKRMFEFYAIQSMIGKLMTFEDLVKQAAKELDITNLGEHFEGPVYASAVSNDLTPVAAPTASGLAQLLSNCLRGALNGAACIEGGFVFKQVGKEIGSESADEIRDSLSFSKYYFLANSSNMRNFGNVYNLFGGKIFQLMMQQIASLSSKALLEASDTDDVAIDVPPVPFVTITSQIVPLAIMFSKYVPNAQTYFEKAQEAADAYSQTTDITADEIHIPGIKAGSQMFPHQVKAQGPLRRRPKVSFLDIDPGGGKTITGIADATACVKEMQKLGTSIKPLMIVPDNLAGNWCDDLTKFLGANWNVIPLTTKTYRRWGEERLADLLTDAPPNTLVVTGINFLKAQTFPLVIGANVVSVSGTLEFVKRFGFNYILMDESHKAKNTRSQVHQTIKQLTTASNVKYVRLATGTLISNVMSDIVGQTALTNPFVFGTKDAFQSANTDEETGAWLPGTAKRSRTLLNVHASVISKKRKEWAFMMPNPIENFYAVGLTDEDNPVLGDKLVAEVYTAVLQETLTSLAALMKTKKSLEELADSENDIEDAADSMDMDMDDNDELAGLENLLKPYLQRLERILTDPIGDPLGAEIFKKNNIETYVTRKVAKVVDLVEKHFTLEMWEKGKEFYRELSIVTHEGQNYLHRKLDTTTTDRKMVANSGKSPDQDLDTWKPEPQGKVLIFCQYTRTVNAVYDALPEHLKKIARKFSGGLTGDNSDKWKNLDDFKRSDDVQILVANERAIAEGHNMQIASRMIRVEQPWAPGDLEQSSARIFRPDPAAAKSMATTGRPGDLYREVIHLDWVLANGTMEVAKFGRLIYKIVSKTQFDETGNPLYDSIMGSELEPISMGLDTIGSRYTLGEFSEYTGLYSEVKNIQLNEFSEMRRTGDATMQDLPETPNVEGARRLENVPLLDDQLIADPDGYGLVSGREFMTDPKNKEFLGNPAGLVGQPVKVEFGTGMVVGVKANYTDQDGQRVVNPHNPIRGLQIRINGSDELVTYPLTQVYFATKLNDTNSSKFVTNKPWATDSQKAKILKSIEAAKEQRDAKAAEDAKAEKKRKIKELRAAEAAEKGRNRTAKRKANKAKGRPLNEGIQQVKSLKGAALPSKPRRKAAPAVQVSDTQENMRIDLTPNVYNGVLGVMVDMADPDAKTLKSLGFHMFGEYTYLTVRTGRHFDAALDYLEDNFKLSNQTISRLDQFADLFDEAENWKFNAELADVTEAKQFFRTRHIVTKGRNEIKVYPNALPEGLMLSVDIRTNPSIRKHLGKKVQGIPGKAGSWQTSPGSAISFVRTKTEAKRILTTLKREGYVVNNEQEFLAELSQLRVRRRGK